MTLQDTFYLLGIFFFTSLIGLNIYLIILLSKIKNNLEAFSSNIKRTAENINITGYSLKAMFLKKVLSFLNPRGGEENE